LTVRMICECATGILDSFKHGSWGCSSAIYRPQWYS